MTERTVRLLACLSLAGLLAACETVKSANPLSPSIAGPIPGVVITEPRLLEPGAGWELNNATQPVRLLIENASSNGQRPLSYTFQVAADAQFGNVVFSRGGVAPGDGGRTSIQMGDRLPTGRAFFWRAWAEDGANTGPYSSAASFSIITPVEIDVPGPIEPVGGARIGGTRPTFRMRNPARSGPAGQLFYQLQVSANEAFAPALAMYELPEQPNETRFDAPLGLPHDQTFFWRVRSYDSGPSGVTGAWTAAQAFRTALAPPPPPTPPPPGPGPGPGAPCGQNTPLGIVQCRRSQYGYMSANDLVAFLRGVARDLNAAGIAGGPFGILRKPGGHNCNGYSCDIICAGQGGSQQQWDTLSDAEGAQIPVWSGPLPQLVVNTCEIQ